jgi:DNA-damage-inducible protein D
MSESLKHLQELKLFESVQVRAHWSAENEKWYFSVVDVVQVLTDSLNPTDYLKKLRKRDAELGDYLGTNCPQVAMPSESGVMRKTLAADVPTLLRLIQSIPSPKAEPFKRWLAKVGHERMQEMADPAQSLDRARENWQKLGRSTKWIQQRMTGQETRNKLTDYWKESGVEKADEFALLTNIIHQEWTGLSVQSHKSLKSLKTQSLRDHMSEAELIFTALAELSTRQIAETEEAQGLQQNAKAGKEGGRVAKRAKNDLEKRTGRKVVTDINFLPPGKSMPAQLPATPERKTNNSHKK